MAILTVGSSGYEVRAWQRIVGLWGAHVDGDFGPGTDAAVKAWQAAHDIEPDGAIGPLCRAAVEPGGIIKAYEGFRPVPYDDDDGKPLTFVGGLWRRPDGGLCKGYPTIGWGRRIWPGHEVFSCTRAQADQWFLDDLNQTRLPAVRRYVPGDAARIAAACSFVYNAGTGPIGKLMADPTEENWTSYFHSKTPGVEAGLLMRRREEWALWAGYEPA